MNYQLNRLHEFLKNKFTISTLLIVCMLLSFFVLSDLIGGDPTDKQGYFSEYLEKQQIRAASAFAIAKGLNAVISVLQSFDLNFFVIGFSPLELLDPLNDVIESISNGLLMALGALTLQRLLVAMNAFLVFKGTLPIALGGLLISVWSTGSVSRIMRQLGIKAAVTSIVLGVFIPASIQLSIFVENTILKNTITNADTSLKQDKGTIDLIGGELAQLLQTKRDTEEADSKFKTEVPPTTNPKQNNGDGKDTSPVETEPTGEQRSWFSGMRDSSNETAKREENQTPEHDRAAADGNSSWWGQTKEKLGTISSSVSVYKIKDKISSIAAELQTKAENMVRDFINLLVVFAITTLLLPLATLWILWQLVRWILNKSFDSALPNFSKPNKQALNTESGE